MADATAPPKAKSSIAVLLVVLLLLTLIGAGTGLGVGAMLASAPDAEPVKVATNEADAGDGHGDGQTAETGDHGTAGAGHGEAPADGDVIAAFQVPAPVPLDEPMIVVPLEPMITNLAAPEGVWLRVEASLLASKELAPAPAILAAEMGAIILAYLRTLKLGDIEGGSGFLAFRDDLDDLVKIASHGAAKKVLVKSLVIE
jgi:flagellar protein FliL